MPSYDAPRLTALWVRSILAFESAVEVREGEERRRSPRWRWAVVFGVLAGWAADTKFTGWFLPVPFLAWTILYRDRRAALTLLVGGAVGLATLYAFNPPWWGDPIGGVRRFFESSLTRGETIPITVRFLGQTYKTPRESLPWYNTLVWTAFVTPVGFLALALVGFARSVRRWRAESFGVLAARCIGSLRWPLRRPDAHSPATTPSGSSCRRSACWPCWPRSGRPGGRPRGGGSSRGGGSRRRSSRGPSGSRWRCLCLSRITARPSAGSPARSGSGWSRPITGTPSPSTPSNGSTPTPRPADRSPSRRIRRRGSTSSVRTSSGPAWSPASRGDYLWYVVQNRPGDFSTTDVGLVLAGTPAYVVEKGGVPLLWIFPYAQVVACEQAQRSQGMPVKWTRRRPIRLRAIHRPDDWPFVGSAVRTDVLAGTGDLAYPCRRIPHTPLNLPHRRRAQPPRHHRSIRCRRT